MDLHRPDSSSFDPAFVPPRGTTSPSLYLIGEAPGEREAKLRMPFVGPSGRLLQHQIKAVGIPDEEIRFFNAVPYRPVDADGRNRKPSTAEVIAFSAFLLSDLQKHKPKAIVCLGRTALTALGIDFPTLKEARSHRHSWDGIPVYATYHPSYHLRMGGKSSSILHTDLKKAWFGEEEDGVLPAVPVFPITKIDRFLSVYGGWKEVVLDYETTGLDVYGENFRLAGAAVSNLRGDEGAYILVSSLEEDYSKDPSFPACLSLFKDWLSSREEISVFNLKYEAGVSLSQLGVDLSDRMVDVMQMARTLHLRGGLKDISVAEIGVSQWEEDVAIWNKAVVTLSKHLALLRGKYRKEVQFLLEEEGRTVDCLEIYFTALKRKQVVKRARALYRLFIGRKVAKTQKYLDEVTATDLLKDEEFVKWIGEKRLLPVDEFYAVLIERDPRWGVEKTKTRLLTLREVEMCRALTNLEFLRERYHIDRKDFYRRITRILLSRIERGDTSYNFAEIPVSILSRYAVQDAISTGELCRSFQKKLRSTSASPPFDNLYQVFQRVYNTQSRLAFSLERNGICWDERRAVEFESIYDRKILDAYREFTAFPRVRGVYDLTETDLLEIGGATDWKISDQKIKINATTAVARDKVSRLFLTPLMRTVLLFKDIHDAHLGNSQKAAREWPSLHPLYRRIMKEKVPERRIGVVLSFTPEFIVQVMSSKVSSAGEMETHRKRMNAPLSTLAQGEFVRMAEAMETILLLDHDDSSTWPEEYVILRPFRLIKKILKAKSTYINKKPGRASVSHFNRKLLPEVSPPRVPGPSSDLEHVNLYDSDFSPCSARTKRWRSNTHTTPYGSDVLGLRTSRYGGVKVHYDFSQNEIRVLASITKEQFLLDAFAEGRDIHREVASKIWGKPAEKITSAERRFSKGATFALLYGQGLHNFAVSYLHGDRKQAKEIFDGFYRAFPRVKSWIRSRHEEALWRGKVKTMWGDPLDVEMPEEGMALPNKSKVAFLNDKWVSVERSLNGKIRKAMRNSQNWPIQSVGSSIAALSIFNVDEEIQRRGLRAKTDTFTHDSCGIDVHLDDLCTVLRLLPEYSVNKIREEFGVPVKVDFDIGVSEGESIAISSIDFSGSSLSVSFKGRKKNLDLLTNRFNERGFPFKLDLSPESSMVNVSHKELFLTGRGYSTDFGRSFEVVSGVLHF